MLASPTFPWRREPRSGLAMFSRHRSLSSSTKHLPCARDEGARLIGRMFGMNIRSVGAGDHSVALGCCRGQVACVRRTFIQRLIRRAIWPQFRATRSTTKRCGWLPGAGPDLLPAIGSADPRCLEGQQAGRKLDSRATAVEGWSDRTTVDLLIHMCPLFLERLGQARCSESCKTTRLRVCRTTGRWSVTTPIRFVTRRCAYALDTGRCCLRFSPKNGCSEPLRMIAECNQRPRHRFGYTLPSMARSKISSARSFVSSSGFPPAVGSAMAISAMSSRFPASTPKSRRV